MGVCDHDLEPHVVTMNHRNSMYREASKHVKIHAAPKKVAKAKGTPKAKAAM